MLWRRLIATLALATPLVPATSARAQGRALGRLLGVFDDLSGRPIAGAEVLDLSTGTKAVTSESGVISLSHLEPGVTLLRIRMLGFASAILSVTVSPADTASMTVLLKPLATTLPEVTTTARPVLTGKFAEFERRRSAGFGRFITRAQLEKWSGHLTADVLRTVPGPYVILGRTARESYIGSTRQISTMPDARGRRQLCYATVILDGAVVYNGIEGEPPFNINSISPDEIEGIEYYASGATTPVEYNTSRNACGLVVIWTR